MKCLNNEKLSILKRLLVKNNCKCPECIELRKILDAELNKGEQK